VVLCVLAHGVGNSCSKKSSDISSSGSSTEQYFSEVVLVLHILAHGVGNSCSSTAATACGCGWCQVPSISAQTV
jgi:hypothetical protein